MKLTKQQLKQIIEEELEGMLGEGGLGGHSAKGGLEVEYVGFDTEHDQTVWYFKVNGKEMELGSTTMSDADDLAERIADEIGPPYEENQKAYDAIEQQLKVQRKFVQDQERAYAERLQYDGGGW